MNQEQERTTAHCDYTRPGVEPWWEELRDCDVEFGHDHPHNEAECNWLMDAMSPEPWDIGYDYPQYDPQQDHFERFGRPAFPNEY